MIDEPSSTNNGENSTHHESADAQTVPALQVQNAPKEAEAEQHQRENSPYTTQKAIYSICKWIKEKAAAANLADWSMVFFTLIIAGATIAYTVYARRQWSAMLTSNGINRDALASVQRAFVIWKDFKVDATPAHSVAATATIPRSLADWCLKADRCPVEVTNEWENAGNTTAPAAIGFFNVLDLPDEPDEETFRGQQSPPPRFVTYVGPKSDLGMTNVKPFSFYIRPGEVGKVNERKIFLFGWIVYRDVFSSNVRLTEFCKKITRFVVEPVDGPKFNIYMNVQNCKAYNCVDNYCGDYNSISSFAHLPPN